MKAIERVEELLSRLTGAASRVSGVVVAVSDLRAVLTLAKEAAELKRRVRLARAELMRLVNANLNSTDAIVTESDVLDTLDLRKPLPKRGAR